MDISTQLLTDWTTLRSSLAKEHEYWNQQADHQAGADLVRKLIKTEEGKGTSITIPYDLLTSEQKKMAAVFMKLDHDEQQQVLDDEEWMERLDPLERARQEELKEKVPSVIFVDRLFAGRVLTPNKPRVGASSFDIEQVGGNTAMLVKTMRHAALFWWGTDPTTAVIEASNSLPPDSQMHAGLFEELPRTGLWVYETPIDIATTGTTNSRVAALGWELTEHGLWMTAMVRPPGTLAGGTRSPEGALAPTWSGWWMNGVALTELESKIRELYNVTYSNERRQGSYEKMDGLAGENITVACNMFFAKLWGASAQWMRQRVLVRQRQHNPLPKNKKKKQRILKQIHKHTQQLPQIEVVQLRRTQPSTTTGTGETRSTYNCRFIVHGFWRNQWYPSRGVHAPKWIDSYVKGPGDKPLKESLRVFSVTR